MYLADSRQADGGRAVGRGSRPGRRAAAVSSTVLALGAVSLITDVSSEMITAVLPLYLVSGLGTSLLGFGVLDGVYNGVTVLVRLIGGRLSDRPRVSHKAVAVVGYGLSALCKPLLLMAHSLSLFGAVLAADRTGKGLRTAPRDAMISLASTPANRGRAFGVHRAMDTAGALLGPLTAFFILRTTVDGYDTVFTVSGCVAALGVMVLLLFVPGRQRSRAGTSDAADSDAEDTDPAIVPSSAGDQRTQAVRELVRRPQVRRLVACAVLLGLTTVSDSFLYLSLQRALHLPEAWFPLLPLGTASAFLLLAVPVGMVADRIDRRRLFLIGHLVLLCAYGVLIAPLGTSPVVAVVVLALHGGFYAATDGVLAAATADAVPEAVRGTGLAVVQTGQAGARFLCSIGFGSAWAAWGDRNALAVAAGGLALSVAVCSWLLRRHHPSHALEATC
ncbi:MFS transporter [Streptomyces sp. HUAS TT7]|uniref:MFS transporter n=1 Tax=Streptomyces sp. HUAS TT7 TaxID=3447507 RepID=UPI003F65F610